MKELNEKKSIESFIFIENDYEVVEIFIKFY